MPKDSPSSHELVAARLQILTTEHWSLLATRSLTTTEALSRVTIFLAILAYVGNLARRGKLPRTRPIVPGEIAVSD